MPKLMGRGTFSSDCGDEFTLLVEVDFGENPPEMCVGDICVSAPKNSVLSFGVHSLRGDSTFTITFEMPLDPNTPAGTSLSVGRCTLKPIETRVELV
jgi:hypothetical protein